MGYIRATEIKFYTKKCANPLCNKEFETIRKYQKYCSRRCSGLGTAQSALGSFSVPPPKNWPCLDCEYRTTVFGEDPLLNYLCVAPGDTDAPRDYPFVVACSRKKKNENNNEMGKKPQ